MERNWDLKFLNLESDVFLQIRRFYNLSSFLLLLLLLLLLLTTFLHIDAPHEGPLVSLNHDTRPAAAVANMRISPDSYIHFLLFY